MNSEIHNVLNFWFEELDSSDWWKKDAQLDKRIEQKFGSLFHRAAGNELFAWRKTDEGRLAEILILDQFSRNIYRDSPLAFKNDGLALALAQVFKS